MASLLDTTEYEDVAPNSKHGIYLASTGAITRTANADGGHGATRGVPDKVTR